MTRRMPDSSYKPFYVTVAQDGTNTTVTIFTDEPFAGLTAVSIGRARRRKGDTRNDLLGMSLATGRAFQFLADREHAYADKILNPPPPEPTFEQAFVDEFLNTLNSVPKPEGGE